MPQRTIAPSTKLSEILKNPDADSNANAQVIRKFATLDDIPGGYIGYADVAETSLLYRCDGSTLIAVGHGGSATQPLQASTLTTTGATNLATTSGNVGVGQTTPTAVLHLKAGTEAANTGPLKIDNGTVATTPENNLIENDGSWFYHTLSNVRRKFAYVIGEYLVLSSSVSGGIKVDTASPTLPWSDLKGTYVFDNSGINAPTIETFAAGVTRLGFNTTDIARTELHIEHCDVAGGIKYIHPHVMIATGATAATTNLVLSHVIMHSYSSIGSGETRGASPAPITVTQTITVAEVNAIGSGNNKAFDIEFANSGGTGGKLNSSNFLPDDLVFVTTTVTSIPSITGGTSTKVSLSPVDMHREVRDGSGTKNKGRIGGSFYS
jgi:hypothetical protein